MIKTIINISDSEIDKAMRMVKQDLVHTVLTEAVKTFSMDNSSGYCITENDITRIFIQLINELSKSEEPEYWKACSNIEYLFEKCYISTNTDLFMVKEIDFIYVLEHLDKFEYDTTGDDV